MSRTFRNNPKQHSGWSSNNSYWVDCIDVRVDPKYIIRTEVKYVSQGGWREAKRILSQVDYANLRKLRGDCFTGYIQNASVPHWYRRELERQYRQHSSLEIHRYWRSDEYETNINEKPGSVDRYDWY